ncbi:CHAT domain-containing protein [Streptomyces fodineus]|uniref:CHAT domain-containing protein n=1 Tax=Streptomyces fodineus TaxID=1904616 RepID=UPI00131B027C|nr:CHAT domain-containing protein [Streptomyces fodineus]
MRLLQECQRNYDEGRLDRAETLLRVAHDHGPAALRASVLQNLGIVALIRWYRTSQTRHLDQAVPLFRAALNGSGGDPDAVLPCLDGLARALRHYARAPELDECVEVYRLLVARSTDADPAHVSLLRRAAEALHARYQLTAERADLTDALGLYRRVAELLPDGDPGRLEALRMRAAGLGRLCAAEPEEAPAEEALAAWRAALAGHPEGHRDRPACQFELGRALFQRYERRLQPEDLDEAVILLHAACRATGQSAEDVVTQVVELCDALVTRARLTGLSGDLDTALSALHHAALRIEREDPNHVALMVKTSHALLTKYHLTGGQDVLDEAIEQGHRGLDAALAHHPGGNPAFVQLPGNVAAGHVVLGNALRERYELAAEPADLDEAIALLQYAAEHAAGHNRAAAAADLASCLLLRSDNTRHTGDVHRAVDVLEAARSALDPRTQSEKRVLLSARSGNVLMHLFERTKDREVLRRAGEAYQSALDALHPRDPAYPPALASLANVSLTVHENTGDLPSLDYAVGCYRQALALCPPNDDDHRLYVDSLGYALRKRYDALGDLADLRECIELLREATAAFPPQHPGQMPTRYSLVQALRAEHLHTGDLDLVRQAAEVALAGSRVGTAPVSRRIQALDVLGHSRATLGDWRAATDALADAVALLPRLASRNRLRMDQHHDLAGMAGTAMSAAACALQAGRPERALELLEQGRGVLLRRRLTARGGLAPLWAADPELARAYTRLRRESDAPEPDARTGPGLGAGEPSWAPDPARDREAEWARLLDRIRALPGFGDFLRPVGARELLAGAGMDTVVMIVPTKYRCDALVLRRGRLEVLPLPELTLEEASGNAVSLQTATAEAHDPGVGARRRMAAQQTVREVLDWLWRTTVRPVLDRLGHHAPPVGGDPWPRLWWCPTGPMAFFPLHAAGAGDDSGDGREAGESALDRVVSSYTPTVEALMRVRSRTPVAAVRARACVVAMGSTPGGYGELPSAVREARVAAGALPDARIEADEAATRDRVLATLAGATHAHFVCHAVSDPDAPAAARLLTHDHADSPLTVADISALGLEQAELAYLSACSTTRGSLLLADEAVHITGAFLLAGFRHVVGTLWETDDAAALEIARRFYAAAGSPPYALHTAVRALRDRYRRTPTLWAAHVHTGA